MNKDLEEQLEYFLTESMEQAVFSNSCDKESILKAKVRPLIMREKLVF